MLDVLEKYRKKRRKLAGKTVTIRQGGEWMYVIDGKLNGPNIFQHVYLDDVEGNFWGNLEILKKHVKTLTLQCIFPLKHVKGLFQCFDETKIDFLALCGCGLYDEHVNILIENTKFINIRVLSLDHNFIGDEGCSVLALYLTKTGLRCLRLTHNRIGDKGLLALGRNLRNIKKLRKLYVESNPVSGACDRLHWMGDSLGLYFSMKYLDQKCAICRLKHLMCYKRTESYLFLLKCTFLMGFHTKYGKDSDLLKLKNAETFERNLIPVIFSLLGNKSRCIEILKAFLNDFNGATQSYLKQCSN